MSEDPLINAVGEDTQKYGRTQISLLSNPQELNFYAYSQNNPVTKSDPAGLGDGTMGYFNNNYSSYPSAVSNMMQQVKYDALKVGAGLPLATIFGGGILMQAAYAPEVSETAAAAYQGALTNVALRATSDIQTGEVSTRKQYAGTAVFGAMTRLWHHRQAHSICCVRYFGFSSS